MTPTRISFMMDPSSSLTGGRNFQSVEEKEYYFLKTVIPSRKATRDYLEMDDPDEKS